MTTNSFGDYSEVLCDKVGALEREQNNGQTKMASKKRTAVKKTSRLKKGGAGSSIASLVNNLTSEDLDDVPPEDLDNLLEVIKKNQIERRGAPDQLQLEFELKEWEMGINSLDEEPLSNKELVTTLRLPDKLRFELSLASRANNQSLPDTVRMYLNNAIHPDPNDEYGHFYPLTDSWEALSPSVGDETGGSNVVIDSKTVDLGHLLWSPIRAMQLLQVAIARPDWLEPSDRKQMSILSREHRFWRDVADNEVQKIFSPVHDKPNILLIEVNMERLTRFSEGTRQEFLFEPPPEVIAGSEGSLITYDIAEANEHKYLHKMLDKVRKYVQVKQDDTDAVKEYRRTLKS